MAYLLLPCFSLLVLAFLISYVKQLITDARRHLPPGPWPLPIIGNILNMNKLPHRALAGLADRHGALMTVRLGTSLFVVASSPAAAREILQTHNASLSGRSPADAWSGGGHSANSVFVLQPGRKRRVLRRLGTAHMFSRSRLQETLALRRDAVAGLLRDVSVAASSGSGGTPVTVSVRRVVFTAMVRLLWRAMFSDDELSEAASRGLYDGVREAVALVMTPNVSDLFPAVAAADIQGVRRRFAAQIARAYKMMDGQIDRRTRARHQSGGGDASRNDLLDAMLDMSEQGDHGGVTINRDVIRAFCTDLFTAALDTTSNTMEWALAELLQNPQTRRKLQEELGTVLGSKSQVEDSDIDKLPYLRAVIKETLRLHSVVPLVSYRAEATVQVQGYTIPEGSNVLVNVWAIHHNANVWTEPHKFLPERFLEKEVEFYGRNFDFIPFGSGRHICLGLPLANRMLHLMLGSLLHQFEWNLPEHESGSAVDMTEKFGLVLSMATPFQVIVKNKQ
ncbi:unnamed protein product [Urochloa decumbens]|uniref:Cytochrome P450 n=1 Tax=Urochloa decumbens TaxID=240449 RepID=A0ABC8XTZ6_9POAL